VVVVGDIAVAAWAVAVVVHGNSQNLYNERYKMQKQAVITMATVCMIFGILGMGISSLAVFSSSKVEVIGAGLGFVAGALLIGTRLISFAIVSKRC